MENEKSLDILASHLEKNASVKNVFGEPITANGRTIIPVAKIAFGLGGGSGHKGFKKSMDSSVAEGTTELPQGSGTGGGMCAWPKGVYDVSDKCTRFIPADSTRHLLFGFIAGFLIKGWFFRKKRW